MKEKKYRFEALDALRGLAILMMVFSANIPFEGALPGWMYHAQVPPPLHQFNPDLPGITWVDLVFPFFLFCMGTAIPFSIGGKMDKGVNHWHMGRDLLIRFFGLALFAIVSQHARPWVMNAGPTLQWPLALLAMVGMVLFFGSPSSGWWSRHRHIMLTIGILILVGLFVALQQFDRVTFRLQRFDIIIMVLANNALAGALIYLLQRKYKHTLWIAFALMSIFFLSGRAGGNWIANIYNYSPIPWLLSWNYLKYLLIIIPGIYTGIVVRDAVLSGTFAENKSSKSGRIWLLLLTSIALIVTSVVGLYIRALNSTFLISIVLVAIFVLGLRNWEHPWKNVIETLLPLTITLLVAGFLSEPLNGGIKKDSATLSYLLLTAGLAIFAMFAFVILIDLLNCKKGVFLLCGSGKNAMLAYIAGSNLVLPLLHLTRISQLFRLDGYSTTLHTIEAVVITLLVAWVSAVAAQKRFFMKV
jgi:predicted acyltransferase